MNMSERAVRRGGRDRHRKATWKTIAGLAAIALALAASSAALAQTGGPPYGWHDGHEGVISDPGMCSAFGWAVDPDNTDRDVWVRVLVDESETPVASLQASDYGEDMDTLGICPEGTCRFTASLWGLISPDAEHTIRVEAHDDETDTWVALEGTERYLTCLTPEPEELWVAAYAHGLPEGTWTEGGYSYHYEYGYTWPEPGGTEVTDEIYFTVWADAPLYDGTVLLRPGAVRAPLGGDVDGGCPAIDPNLNPGQPTAFVWGQLTPEAMTYPEAVAHFDSGVSTVVIDGGSIELSRQEILPWQGIDWWMSYVCSTFAVPEPPPPSPWFFVFPTQEYVEAWDWPLGTEVTATVTHPDFSECSGSALSGHPWWDENAVVAEIFLPDGCDVEPGDVVSVSDGLTGKEHTVTGLEVTWFDVAENVAGGSGAPELEVDIWVHGVASSFMTTTAAGDGSWAVDFDDALEPYELERGSGGSARQRDADGDGTSVNWYVPNPWFSVFPAWEYVEAWDWPLGTEVTAIVTHPDLSTCMGSAISDHPGWDENAIVAQIHLPEGCTVESGDLVNVSDGETAKEHLVTALAVTGFDVLENIAAGEATPGLDVQIWVHGVESSSMTTAPAEDGSWAVDFDGAFEPYNLQPGTAGRARQRDADGDDTSLDWQIPNPRFTVFPEWEWLEAYEWTDGVPVTVTVAGRPECETEAYPSDGYFGVGFPDGCDVADGDVVALTDGSTSKQLTVPNLAVTWFDLTEGFVGGTGSPDLEVHIWVHEVDSSFMITTPDELGDWGVDFDDVGFTIVPGTGGRAEQVDEDSDATAVDWAIPTPRLAVYLEGEFVIGWDWPPGAEVHLTIDDPTNGEGADFEADTVVEPAPWDPNTWWAIFEFAGMYDVKPGDLVVVTDGTSVREHVVLPLTVDDVDGEADTVAGTSDPGAAVYVYPWGSWFDPVVADGSGNWLMDFTGLYDLVPGTWATAEVFEDDGDSTAIDWTVPLPVQIDIRPWSSLNLVLCRATWDLLPVALFSTADFDATAVDHDTVRFGKTGIEAEVVMAMGRPLRYARDVNRDGLLDMVYTFRFGDTGFSCADIPAGRYTATVEASLTGWMGNLFFEGSDTLRLYRLFVR